jgi:outer membrane protein assembly factor BamB
MFGFMTYRDPRPPEPLVSLLSSVAVALDRDTGKQLWRYQASTRLVRVVYTVDRIFLLDADCVLHCLRLSDGFILGRVKVDEKSYWGCAMLPGRNGELYVATSQSVVALDATGREIWRFKHGDVPGSSGGGLGGLALLEGVVQPDIRD